MNFFYTIRPEFEKEEILQIPSPYIIEEFAKSFMQSYIKEQNKIMGLQDGIYIVSLYKDTLPHPQECGLSNKFKKSSNEIIFLDSNQEI